MIVIVDYGLGNLGSIRNMLEFIGFDAVVSSDKETVLKADKLILPGVGSFDQGMINLRERELIPVLNQRILTDKVPILGICLGMQLFGLKSEEGSLPGLSWLELESKKFNPPDPLLFPVPHLGWEYVSVKNNGSKLLKGFDDETKFYFAHSYYVSCKNREEVLLEANYIHSFDASVQKEHIAGVQFHPEKSHKHGMQLLTNFVSHF
ncbi:imidazole glycerol phosphate synthase subunit HisH [uncultured Fluviicola sp.]|uniref:imidazole glycerol phosphate synthase subunit HisH n=1 Tax=uncultured Fluviicola sp. TaxID=463303 RepID=UPI0025D5952B|nr:imidazole glycerol phosphate synthase subunit HisH [uncultured Fluviicola sp.]